MKILRGHHWANYWLLIWSACAFLARLFANSSYHLEQSLAAPNLFHPFGYDAFGRDLLVTTLKASATSLFFSATAVFITGIASTTLGGILAITHPWMRVPLLRALEFFLAFPSLLLALTWAAIKGPGWDTLIISLLLGSLPSLIRLAYTNALQSLDQDYLTASRSLGASNLHILRFHLLPELVTVFRIKAPIVFAHVLLAEATLSFLGIGAPIGYDSWGSLLAQGREYLLEAPHLAFGSGLPLVITLFAMQHLMERLDSKALPMTSETR